MDYTEVFKKELLPLKDKIYRFALSIVKNKAMAEDIVQDIYGKLWAKREKWESWGNLEAMSMTMTRNLSIDNLKLKANNTYAIPDGYDKKDLERNPEEKTINLDQRAMLKRALEQLTELQRSVVQLRDIEGYKYKEIAEMLDVSLPQVKVNLHRARLALKEIIKNSLRSEKR